MTLNSICFHTLSTLCSVDIANAVVILSIPAYSLVYLRMLDQMSFLSEGFRAHVTSEGLLACMRPEMNFDVRLVQEASVTDGAPVDGFLFA